MKILYIDHGNRLSESYTYQYYGDLYRELCELAEVYVFQGIPDDIVALTQGHKFDCVIFGLGYFAQRDPRAYGVINKLNELDSLVVCLIHKPQIMLKEKLSFCKFNNIDLLVDSQVTYKDYGNLLDTESIRIWFSATPKIYKPREVPVIYDVGFSGASHGNGKIEGPTADLRDRVHHRLVEKDLKLFWNRQTAVSDRISSTEEYATKMNECKIWIATTGPVLDVSPRYFEVILSKTLLFCNEMPKQYEGVFIDGVNCVTYKNDLSDFDEKLNFYLTNESERVKIIENAYDTFLNNYTSKHMCLKLLNKIEEMINEKV